MRREADMKALAIVLLAVTLVLGASCGTPDPIPLPRPGGDATPRDATVEAGA
jgi:hypothetical protein